jgi:hypothetical protein
MNRRSVLLASVVVGLTAMTAYAQPGNMAPTPSFDGALGKLFGDNADFNATMEFHFTDRTGADRTMSGKIAHSESKSRFEMDLSALQANMPPQARARMQQMGMSRMVSLTRRDKGMSYLLYPDMKAYVTTPLKEAYAPMSSYKSDVTKLGTETVDGHDCVKNKVVVTASDGSTHEATVWNAADLKQFPIKIQAKTQHGNDMDMAFKDVKFEKPDESQFEPPSDYAKYDDVMSLMMNRARAGQPQ